MFLIMLLLRRRSTLATSTLRRRLVHTPSPQRHKTAHRETLQPLMELCTRRGFIYPGSSIYGGMASTFDYGPLGSQLKKNILDAWWKDFVELRPECVGLDTSVIMHPDVWRASGHVEEFTDPLVQCTECNHRTRADKLLEDQYNVSPEAVATCIHEGGMVALREMLSNVSAACPACNSTQLGEPANFNLLFQTSVGATSEEEVKAERKSRTEEEQNHTGTTHEAYLRPETAQGAYINFANVINSTRKRLPLGIGQVGKAFRNEISPGKSFLFRTREFELMELQWFIQDDNKEAEKWYRYWVDTCMKWLTDHGVSTELVRAREHSVDEVAHYAKGTTDIEYDFPGLGWGELWGIADRGTYDVEQHIYATTGGAVGKQAKTEAEAEATMDSVMLKKWQKKEKKRLKKAKKHPLLYLDPDTGKRSVPRVIEPALGLTRVVLAILSSAMDVETVKGDNYGEEAERTVMRLHPRLAPIKVAVLPLLKNRTELVEMSEKLHAHLASRFSCELDLNGSIGKRYRRQDEIGTPLCITVDVDSLEDHSVTIRDRDTLKQIRLPLEKIERTSLDDMLRLF